MSKKQKKAVKRVLWNWRDILAWTPSESGLSYKHIRYYAEAYFMGAWSAMSDKQANYLLGKLNKHDRKIIMKYPIYQ